MEKKGATKLEEKNAKVCDHEITLEYGILPRF